MKFEVEIVETENGYIIFEGNRYYQSPDRFAERKKWVCIKDFDKLGQLISKLAEESHQQQIRTGT